VFPAEIDFDSLPKSVQDGFAEVVGPCPEKLVLGEPDPLLKAMGHTLSLASTLEMMAADKAIRALAAPKTDPAESDRLLVHYDRVKNGKQRAANFLQRAREFDFRNRQHRAACEEAGDAGILKKNR